MTSTFAFDSAAEKEAAVDSALAWQPEAYFYSRTGNPTTYALECKVASLEGAEDSVVSSAGMAAVSGALFSLLNAGGTDNAALRAKQEFVWQAHWPQLGVGRVAPALGINRQQAEPGRARP